MDTTNETLQQIADEWQTEIAAFKSAYIAHAMNPAVDSYENIWSDSKSSLTQLTGRVFGIVQNIQTNISQLRQGTHRIYADIRAQRERLRTHAAIEGELTDSTQAADQSLEDMKYLYGQQWWQNAELIFGTAASVWLLVVTFRPRT